MRLDFEEFCGCLGFQKLKSFKVKKEKRNT